MPKPTRPKPPAIASSETALVKTLMQYLPMKFKGRVYISRNNTGATKTQTGAFLRFGDVGAPDITGVLAPEGRFVGIECKSAKGRISDHQKEWLLRAASLGALVGIVRTVAEAEAMLETGECHLDEIQPKSTPNLVMAALAQNTRDVTRMGNQEQKAINDIIEGVDGWMQVGDFARVDIMIKQVTGQVQMLSPAVLLSVLSASYVARERLSHWSELIAKSSERLSQEFGAERMGRLMHGWR